MWRKSIWVYDITILYCTVEISILNEEVDIVPVILCINVAEVL
jgi:hypothetical protein